MIRTPALRHLAWLCTAPPLWQFPDAFVPADWLPADWYARLQHWDATPQEAPAFVHALPNPRLGLYFETLYDALLTHLLGWQVLARNLPIRAGGLTLGELDFVVRNPHTGEVEHHEIAVKFYLGYQAQPHGPAQWLGPNPADSLEGKAHRMQHEQALRAQLPEAQVALVGAGLPANAVRLQASSHKPANASKLPHAFRQAPTPTIFPSPPASSCPAISSTRRTAPPSPCHRKCPSLTHAAPGGAWTTPCRQTERAGCHW
jgi:hypothetical protein